MNGKRNGKGKEYDYKGKLIFEGKYLIGKRWNGNKYDKKGNIIYIIKNEDRYGKEYYDNDILENNI